MKGAKIMTLIVIVLTTLLFPIKAKAEQELPDTSKYGAIQRVVPGKPGYYVYNGSPSAFVYEGNNKKYGWGYKNSEEYCRYPVSVSYDVTYNYDEAYKMIDKVNALRKKAGVSELKTNDVLMQIAMERAAEISLYFSHTRPDGTSNQAKSFLIWGENIYRGSSSVEGPMKAFTESKWHYQNMVSPSDTYAGYGCVGGCWVQIFSFQNGEIYEVDGLGDENRKIVLSELPLTKMKNTTVRFTAEINPKLFELRAELHEYKEKFNIGEKAELDVALYAPHTKYSSSTNFLLSADQYSLESLTPDICTVKGNKITFTKSGTAKVKATLNSDSSLKRTIELKVKAPSVKSGSKVNKNGVEYKVTSTKNKTVTLNKVSSNQTGITVPAAIKINGKSYKVTSIAAAAFKNNTEITSVTIGNNVTSIGNNAFYKCTNLKKVTFGSKVSKIGSKAFYGCKELKDVIIKTKKLSSSKIGSQAFKGISKKAAFKVPKSKVKPYKKMLKAKGAGSKIKVKK